VLRQSTDVLLWLHGPAQPLRNVTLRPTKVCLRGGRAGRPGVRHSRPLPFQVGHRQQRSGGGSHGVHTANLSAGVAAVDRETRRGRSVRPVCRAVFLGRLAARGKLPARIRHSTRVLLHQTSPGKDFTVTISLERTETLSIRQHWATHRHRPL